MSAFPRWIRIPRPNCMNFGSSLYNARSRSWVNTQITDLAGREHADPVSIGLWPMPNTAASM